VAATFHKAGVELTAVELIVIRRLNRRVKRAVRAHARYHTFTRQLAVWKRVAPKQRALRKAGAPVEQIAALNRLRPAWFAPDARGRYAWARHQLLAELRDAWPRTRRTDTLQTAVLQTVRLAIVKHLHEPGRDLEHGTKAKADRLAAEFLGLHFPLLANGTTPDRLRRRPSLRTKTN
jgi:hypothetical protein